MKKSFKISLTIFLILVSTGENALTQKGKFFGEWNFNAPEAPSDYAIGEMIVTEESFIINYPGSSMGSYTALYSLENDTLTYTVSDVTGKLGFVDDNTLAGYTFWSGGYSLITLTRKHSPVEQNKAIAQKFIDLWTNHDSIGIANLYADKFVGEDLAFGVKITDKPGVVSFVNGTVRGVPDLEFISTSIIASDSMAMVEWIWKGTFTIGFLPNYPGTNKPFSVRGASVMNIRNGKIIRLSDYYDKNTFLKAVGLQYTDPKVIVKK